METDDERMARLLRAASTAAEFLSADLGRILDNKRRSSSHMGSAASTAISGPVVNGESLPAQTVGGTVGGTVTVGGTNDGDGTDILEALRHISVEAAEYSRLSSNNSDKEGGGDFSIDTAVERAEALCSRIEALLSTHSGRKSDNYKNNNEDSNSNNSSNSEDGAGPAVASASQLERKGSSDSNSDYGRKRSASNNVSSIADVRCPNGRRDLALRLATARDALLPVIGERTNLGSLRVALLGLTASVEASLEQKQASDLLEGRWKDLSNRVSGLTNSVDDIEGSLRSNDHHRRGSASDDDGGGNGGSGVTEDDLEDRLGYKADVSWVQRELQRLWEALDSRAMASVVVAASGTETAGQDGDPSRPRSAPSTINPPNSKENSNPETAGEEESDVDASSTPKSKGMGTSLPSSLNPLTGSGGGPGGVGSQQAELRARSSFNEGSSLIKDLLRKTSRLEQQVGRCLMRVLLAGLILVDVKAPGFFS